MPLIHRMCDAIGRGYYGSVASHSGRKKRVEHTFNDPGIKITITAKIVGIALLTLDKISFK